jgi:hypothetical protein
VRRGFFAGAGAGASSPDPGFLAVPGLPGLRFFFRFELTACSPSATEASLFECGAKGLLLGLIPKKAFAYCKPI